MWLIDCGAAASLEGSPELAAIMEKKGLREPNPGQASMGQGWFMYTASVEYAPPERWRAVG